MAAARLWTLVLLGWLFMGPAWSARTAPLANQCASEFRKAAPSGGTSAAAPVERHHGAPTGVERPAWCSGNLRSTRFDSWSLPASAATGFSASAFRILAVTRPNGSRGGSRSGPSAPRGPPSPC